MRISQKTAEHPGHGFQEQAGASARRCILECASLPRLHRAGVANTLCFTHVLTCVRVRSKPCLAARTTLRLVCVPRLARVMRSRCMRVTLAAASVLSRTLFVRCHSCLVNIVYVTQRISLLFSESTKWFVWSIPSCVCGTLGLGSLLQTALLKT